MLILLLLFTLLLILLLLFYYYYYDCSKNNNRVKNKLNNPIKKIYLTQNAKTIAIITFVLY